MSCRGGSSVEVTGCHDTGWDPSFPGTLSPTSIAQLSQPRLFIVPYTRYLRLVKRYLKATVEQMVRAGPCASNTRGRRHNEI